MDQQAQAVAAQQQAGAAQQQAAQQQAQAVQAQAAAQQQAQQQAQAAAQQQNAAPFAAVRARVAYNTNQISKPSVELFHGKESEDILTWLYSFEKIVNISGWNDQEAMDFAELAMRDKAKLFFIGLLTRGVNNFAAIKQELIIRFGESQTTLMTRLEHRKQKADENVRDYIDAMRILFAKTNYPVAGQANRFMSNLNDTFRERVINRMPQTMDEAVACALWHEDRDIGATPERAAALADRRAGNSGSDVSKFTKDMANDITKGITEGFGKLALQLNTQHRRFDAAENRMLPPRPNQPIVCFNCGEPGHKTPQCTKPRGPPRQATQNMAQQSQWPNARPPPSLYPGYAKHIYPAQAPARTLHYAPARSHFMSKVEEPVHQPTLNLWTAAPAAVPAATNVLPGAEIYAGATTRPVPFSPEAMNRRRVAPASGPAPNRNTAGPAPFPSMPAIP